MRTRMILALAAAGMLAAACASGATQAPSTAPTPAPSVTAAPSQSAPPSDPTAAPTATPVQQTDGEGDEVVVGKLENATVTKEYTEQQVGDVLQYRDGLLTGAQTMNDPRVTGSAQWEINLDLYTKAARQWGAYTLTNDGGSWAGSCTGGAWADEPSKGPGNFAWGCWLTGSGDYEGYTFYQTVIREAYGDAIVHGMIYKGAPPTA